MSLTVGVKILSEAIGQRTIHFGLRCIETRIVYDNALNLELWVWKYYSLLCDATLKESPKADVPFGFTRRALGNCQRTTHKKIGVF